MKKLIVAIAAIGALGVQSLSAQALNYDPYYVLPGKARAIGVDLGLATPDAANFADATDIDLMGKYAVNDMIEVGGRASFGFLNEGADSFSSIVLGAKYALNENTALTLNLTPFNEAEEIGLSLGAMHSMPIEAMDGGLNSQLQLGLLDAYAPVGIAVDILLQPVRPINDKFTGYLDVLITTNTDDMAEYLSVLVAPNVDMMLAEGWTLNAGIYGSAMSGDFAENTEFGLIITVLRDMHLQ